MQSVWASAWDTMMLMIIPSYSKGSVFTVVTSERFLFSWLLIYLANNGQGCPVWARIHRNRTQVGLAFEAHRWGTSSVLTVWGKLCLSIRYETLEDRNCGTFYFQISWAWEALVRGLKRVCCHWPNCEYVHIRSCGLSSYRPQRCRCQTWTGQIHHFSSCWSFTAFPERDKSINYFLPAPLSCCPESRHCIL